MSDNRRMLSTNEGEELLSVLKERFEQNMQRHEALKWDDVQAKLEENAGKLWSLSEME